MDHGRDKSLSPDITRLSRLLLRNPASRLFVPLAEAYLKSGMRDEALLVLNEGIRHHPTFIAALVMLGKIYFKMGGPSKAKDLFEQALAINSENIPSLKNLGAIYQEEGQLHRALEVYRTILMIDPGDRAARRLFVALEAETSAMPELEPAPVDSDGTSHCLPIEAETKQEEMAETNDFQTLRHTPQAQELGTDEREGREDREEETGESNEVESAPEETVKTEETVETLTLASIYMRQKCYREAADIYNKFLARDPTDSESRNGLEEALSRLSEDSKEVLASSAPSRREKEIARLEKWLHVVQKASRG